MFTYSVKITFLMVLLSFLNGGVTYLLTEDAVIFSQVLASTYIVQLVLVFTTGQVKYRKTNKQTG